MKSEEQRKIKENEHTFINIGYHQVEQHMHNRGTIKKGKTEQKEYFMK